MNPYRKASPSPVIPVDFQKRFTLYDRLRTRCNSMRNPPTEFVVDAETFARWKTELGKYARFTRDGAIMVPLDHGPVTIRKAR